MLSAFDNIKLKIVVDPDELKALFLKAAKVHREKAAYFRATAEKVDIEPVDTEDEDFANITTSYGNSIASNVKGAKQGLLQKARDHEASAVQKEFIANHLPVYPQEVNATDLMSWGVVN